MCIKKIILNVKENFDIDDTKIEAYTDGYIRKTKIALAFAFVSKNHQEIFAELAKK